MLHPDPEHLEVADADSLGFSFQMNTGQSSGQRMAYSGREPDRSFPTGFHV